MTVPVKMVSAFILFLAFKGITLQFSLYLVILYDNFSDSNLSCGEFKNLGGTKADALLFTKYLDSSITEDETVKYINKGTNRIIVRYLSIR